MNDVLTTSFSWIGSSSISLLAASGSSVEIRRNTPKSPAQVTFYDGSTLTETDLNLEITQLLYAMQESLDEAGTKLGYLFPGKFNALGNRIVNLGTPQDAADATTKLYVDQLSASDRAYTDSVSVSDRAYTDAGVASAESYADMADLLVIDKSKHIAEQLIAGTVSGAGSFIADGTGAVLRTFQDKLREFVSAKDFGAVGDGVTGNQHLPIQAAIDAVYAKGGGAVRVPAGTYLLGASINRKPGVFLLGDGAEFTCLKATGDFAVVSSVGSISNVLNRGGVADMLIRGFGKTNANSHGIYEAWTNRTQFQNVRFHGCRYAMYASNVWQNKWDNLQADGGGTDQNYIGFYMDAVDPANQNNAVQAVNCMAQDCSQYGWRLINFNGSKFVNCEGAGSAIHGWYLGDPVTGTEQIRWGHFVNCLADSTSSHGWRLEKGASAAFQQVQFTNCWSGNSTGGHGWRIAGVSQCVFASPMIISSNQSSMHFVQSTRCVVAGAVCMGYDGANASNAGILLDASQYISIDDKCQIYTTTSGPSVKEVNGSNFNGMGAWQNPPVKAGAASFFRWVGQEKSGSAVINSGTTSVVVNHGLAFTPSVNDISLTARDSGAGAGGYYVNNVTATSFTINSVNAPSGNVTIAWRIIPLS